MYLLLYLQLSKTSLSLVFVTVYFVSEVLRVKVTAFVLVIHSTELKKPKQLQKTKKSCQSVGYDFLVSTSKDKLNFKHFVN